MLEHHLCMFFSDVSTANLEQVFTPLGHGSFKYNFGNIQQGVVCFVWQSFSKLAGGISLSKVYIDETKQYSLRFFGVFVYKKNI